MDPKEKWEESETPEGAMTQRSRKVRKNTNFQAQGCLRNGTKSVGYTCVRRKGLHICDVVKEFRPEHGGAEFEL